MILIIFSKKWRLRQALKMCNWWRWLALEVNSKWTSMIQKLNAFAGKLIGWNWHLSKSNVWYLLVLVFRAHLNDLENILPYLFVGLFYVLTNPSPTSAILLFKVAAIARIVHTIVYTVVIIPQPARGIAYAIHVFITFYMAVAVLLQCKWF